MTAEVEAIPAAIESDREAGFEALFLEHYARIARAVARIIGDRGRAEELGVDVFLKWQVHPEAHGEAASGWLYRTAVRMAFDELRRQARRARFEQLTSRLRHHSPTPEDVHTAASDRERVRRVLATLRRRDALLLLLKHEGLSYQEIAAALHLKASSIGTLISRAEHAFRRRYEGRYGTR
jgi:RNA polymerase sigma-70 factor (ECF subfamily)